MFSQFYYLILVNKMWNVFIDSKFKPNIKKCQQVWPVLKLSLWKLDIGSSMNEV